MRETTCKFPLSRFMRVLNPALPLIMSSSNWLKVVRLVKVMRITLLLWLWRYAPLVGLGCVSFCLEVLRFVDQMRDMACFVLQ